MVKKGIKMKLSILVCHLPKRKHYLDRLCGVLNEQLEYHQDVEFLVDDREKISIGTKRNNLLNRASGEYVAFIDDDDLVSHDYLKQLLSGIDKGVDCCSLMGEITENGANPKTFIHSIRYDKYFEKDKVYYRPPNHLNCIKASIAKQFKFPMRNHGEDTDWAMQICEAGVLKTEHRIEETIYYYEYRSKK